MFKYLSTKSLSILLFLALTSYSSLSEAKVAEEGDLGLGLSLGWPTGFTGKYKLPSDHAIDFGLGWHIGDSLTLYGDYLFEFHNVFEHEEDFISSLLLYVGGGALIEIISSEAVYYRNPNRTRTSNFLFALRIPFGVEWPLPHHPIRLGFEIVPGMSLFPHTSVIIQGAVTGRYFF